MSLIYYMLLYLPAVSTVGCFVGIVIAFYSNLHLEKGEDEKTIKIMAGITAIILIGILLCCYGMVGNLFQRPLPNKCIKIHTKKLPQFGLKVERVNYSFKTGSYYALIKASIDTL